MILFLYGTDSVRSKRKLDEIVAKFKLDHDPGGMNLATVDASKAELGDVQQALFASPFLSTRRMVIVSNLLTLKKDEQQSIAELVEKLPVSTVAVFYERAEEAACKKSPLWKILTAGKYHWEFAPLAGAQLSAWYQKEAQSRGVSLAPMAVTALMAAVGPDLARAENEIAKLAAYVGAKPSLSPSPTGREISPPLPSGEGQPLNPPLPSGERVGGEGRKLITPEDIALLVSGEVQENMFGFLDAVAAKSPAHAARLLEEQIAAGTESMQLLAMIARTVRLLIQSKDLLDRHVPEPDAVRELGVHPFAARKSLQQARRFDMPTLLSLHARLLDADRKIKTGLSPSPRVMLDLLVAKTVA
jgi:DNA polymerase-3 subunit delta